MNFRLLIHKQTNSLQLFKTESGFKKGKQLKVYVIIVITPVPGLCWEIQRFDGWMGRLNAEAV